MSNLKIAIIHNDKFLRDKFYSNKNRRNATTTINVLPKTKIFEKEIPIIINIHS